MKKTYNEFLESIGIISEEEFNELMELLPNIDVNLEHVNWGDYDDFDVADVAHSIIDEILSDNWAYVYLDGIDIKEKTLELSDVDSIKDLDEIKEMFSNFTISNYNDLKEDILEEEEYHKSQEEENIKKVLLKKLGYLVDIEELKNLIQSYDNAKGNS